MSVKLALVSLLTFSSVAFATVWEERPNDDRQIVGMILTTSELATSVSGLVFDQLGHPDVIAFAKDDIGRHEAYRDNFSQFGRRNRTRPELSEISIAMSNRTREQTSKLMATKNNIDKLYIDLRVNEIQLEQRLLNHEWLRRADHPELRALLMKLRPEVNEALKRAVAIQKFLAIVRYAKD